MSAPHWLGSQLAQPAGWGGWLVGQAMRVANRRPIALAVDALELGPDDVALDLGCGPGQGVALLARTARRVHGVDASQVMLRAAAGRNRHAAARGVVTIEEGRFDAIPLPDASVDKVLAANVAYFWPDFAPVLAEVRRVARPGGRLAIYVTDRETMRHWRFAGAETHRHFDAPGLALALREAGIDSERLTIRADTLPMGVRALTCIVEF